VYIDIVIVNWNAGFLIKECIDSIIKFKSSSVSKIIVVDNNSTDGSENFLDNYADVTLIRAGENLGFGKACNLGASLCQAEFILFLNPDTQLRSCTLSKVLRYMHEEENAKVGICGVQLFDERDQVARSCSRAPSAGALLAHAIGMTKIFPSFGDAMREWDHSCTRIVDQVIGAFFLVRRNLFLSLDGFDERFFVYFEEVDFSVRAKNMGWYSVYFSDAEAFHLGGGTSYQVKAKRTFYSMRSRIQYAFKHFSVPSVLIVLFVTLCIEPISRSVFALSKGSIVSFKENLRAYNMLYSWFFRFKFGEKK